jgi:hypothetical protein
MAVYKYSAKALQNYFEYYEEGYLQHRHTGERVRKKREIWRWHYGDVKLGQPVKSRVKGSSRIEDLYLPEYESNWKNHYEKATIE